MKLEGKRAIVTGAGRGIGRAIALALAREGADVCVTARTSEQIDLVAEEINATGRHGLAHPCDVAVRSEVEKMVAAAAETLGPIDILVNNAGGGLERKKVGRDNPERWARVIEINLLGTYYCSRAVLPSMRKAGGGSIINIGSGMGHQPQPRNSSYNTAKAGVWMLTRCMAMELWKHNVAVNELIPGPVYTDLTASMFSPDRPHPSFSSEWVKQPDDVAPLAVFLATQPPKGPTGQSFSLARRPI